MTKEESIAWLRQYRRKETDAPTKKLFDWKRNVQFDRAVYERFLVQELIGCIQKSKLPPIEVVRRLYYRMDDILTESENPRVWAFASTMENCAGDILRYLREKERCKDERDMD